MTQPPETGAINRLHFLPPIFGANFSHHIRLELQKLFRGKRSTGSGQKKLELPTFHLWQYILLSYIQIFIQCESGVTAIVYKR